MFTISGTLILPSSLTVTVAKSWREREICLNKPWMVALPSLPKVSIYIYIWCYLVFRIIKMCFKLQLYLHIPYLEFLAF